LNAPRASTTLDRIEKLGYNVDQFEEEQSVLPYIVLKTANRRSKRGWPGRERGSLAESPLQHHPPKVAWELAS
jgi:hypothetical protein